MRVGIAADHGGFGLKEELVAHVRAAGHELVDFGAHELNLRDDYPDFVIPLGRCDNRNGRARHRRLRQRSRRFGLRKKIPGIHDALVHDHFSAWQGVEDDNMNIICMVDRAIGPFVAWDLVEAFLGAAFSQAERQRRRLDKIASLELEATGKKSA